MRTLNEYFLYGAIVDISTSDQIYIAVPDGGWVRKIYSVIDAAITSGDATLTSKIGGTAITNGALTVANSGSAAGDVDTATPTALNRVEAGGSVEIETNGNSQTTAKCAITLVIRR